MCSIYKRRPKECREFTCAWLEGLGGDAYRPDRINIVSTYNALPDLGIVLSLWEVVVGALSTSLVRNWTLRNIRSENPTVHIPIVESPKLYLPEKVLTPINSFEMEESRRPIEIITFGQAVFELDR